MAQTVKSLPKMQETQVMSLGWEDPWRREWLPTLVFLPREFHGQRSLTGYSLWGHVTQCVCVCVCLCVCVHACTCVII